MSTKAKTYINVAYKDRELAKRLGARWDPAVKRWYCPADSTLALIYKWRKAPVVSATDEAPAPAANAPAKVERSVREHRVRRKSLPDFGAADFVGNLELPLAS